MRTIVLWCPDWPVRALMRAELVSPQAPVALIEKGLVFACSKAARVDGVRRGLRVREAQARCPQLVQHPYDPAFDVRSFEGVLTAIEQLMPGVQSIRPGMCAIRARGPSRYYGGERSAAAALRELLTEHGVPDACVGVADGPFAAEQAARRVPNDRVRIIEQGGSPAFVAGLPIAVIDDPAFVALARRLGIRALGDIAAIDVVDLQNRFGETGTRIHALASGRDGNVVVPRVPLPTLEQAVEFEPGLERVDQVTFGFRSAADDFLAGLTAAALVCTAVLVQVSVESGALFERVWLHPRWFTAADVVDRVRWQLQGSGASDSGLNSAVTRVAVSPESVDAIGNHEAGLWGDGPDERIHHALSRVQSMLGHEAVVTAVVGGGRRLEERQVLVPWGDRPPADVAASRIRPWPGSLPPPLPTTVFTPPRPVSVFTQDGSVVDVAERGTVTGEPAWFSVQGSFDQTRSIATWAGPWPIEERWWDAEQARQAHRFHVVDADGMAWLLLLEGHRWSAEARYD
jgi:protein ImuB